MYPPISGKNSEPVGWRRLADASSHVWNLIIGALESIFPAMEFDTNMADNGSIYIGCSNPAIHKEKHFTILICDNPPSSYDRYADWFVKATIGSFGIDWLDVVAHYSAKMKYIPTDKEAPGLRDRHPWLYEMPEPSVNFGHEYFLEKMAVETGYRYRRIKGIISENHNWRKNKKAKTIVSNYIEEIRAMVEFIRDYEKHSTRSIDFRSDDDPDGINRLKYGLRKTKDKNIMEILPKAYNWDFDYL